MYEKIRIDGFLVIKHASLELNKINILIGSQASGKSIIAKICYYFRFISKHFIDAIRTQQSKRQLDKTLLRDFETRFPRYAWDSSTFSIIYEIDELTVRIVGHRNAKGKTTLSIEYSDELVKLYNTKKRFFQKRLAEVKSDKLKSRILHNNEAVVMYEAVLEPLKSHKYHRFFTSSVFIPASRSFFANLQKNIFTFMASNLDIDPFLKEFGSLYETSKRFSQTRFVFNDKKSKSIETLSKALDPLISAIIVGKYEFDEEQDWIVSRNRRVNLANASSGQQESLPMLLVLSIWPLIRDTTDSMFFIEEPEAHLFPTSQTHIIAMLSILYNQVGASFFLTSHSPYILSALNNHILAGEAVEAKKITIEDYSKMGGAGVPISFTDVSAYAISDGTLNSLVDNEYKMIGGDLLDSVSDHFGKIAGELLDIIG